MTGTAKTEEEEFKSIYKMDVFQVPTNKPLLRKDLADSVYANQLAKFRAVARDIKERHERKQPVLVGTVSIEKSELLSSILAEEGIAHEVLNAKFHEKEAEIIAQAGRLGAVTIATNMAGRGTDILLGGNPSFMALKEMKRLNFTDEMINRVNSANEVAGVEANEEYDAARKTYKKLYEEYKLQTDAEQLEVIEAGGLCILGTERHESRRIDNQLRGRAGRQGDPGESRFYIGLDDDLMRLFGSERVQGLLEKLGLDDETPIEHRMLTKSIENAQKKVEGKNFGIRKHVLEYDDVMNKQREIIYAERRRVLSGENLQDQIQMMMRDVITESVALYTDEKEEFDHAGYRAHMYRKYLPGGVIDDLNFAEMTSSEALEATYERLLALYTEKEEFIGSERMREVERVILLQSVDNHWIDHIDAMDQLRQGIGLRAIGQIDPVIAYKMEGFDMFDEMNKLIREDTVSYLFNIQIEVPVERKAVVDVDNLESPDMDGVDRKPSKSTPEHVEEKIGRNDLCPCGSGKKYKNCCGK
jgi:protein translocase subunit secA 1